MYVRFKDNIRTIYYVYAGALRKMLQ